MLCSVCGKAPTRDDVELYREVPVDAGEDTFNGDVTELDMAVADNGSEVETEVGAEKEERLEGVERREVGDGEDVEDCVVLRMLVRPFSVLPFGRHSVPTCPTKERHIASFFGESLH